MPNTQFSRCGRRALLLSVASVLAAAAPHAAGDVWDNSTGNGFWSTPGNWQDDTEPSLANADNVFLPVGFPGGDSTIILEDAVSESAVGVFFEDSYFLTGAPLASRLQLFSPGNIGVSPGKTGQINSQLHSFVGLTKVGTGTLVLNNSANSFTGTVGVSAGTLKPGPGTLGTNPVQISPGGILEINGTHFTNSLGLNSGTLNGFGIATWSGTITPGAGTSNIVTSDTFTIGNAADDITGGASSTLAVSGSGALVLPFSNNYAGGWQVTSGTLRANHPGALGTGTTPIVVTGPGKLEIANNTTLSRGLTLNHGATVTLQAGTASITGTTSIAPGAGVHFTIAGGFTTLNIGNELAGLSGGGGGSSITFDNGFFVLGFASSYTGNLIVNNATLRFGADAHLGDAANPLSLTNSLVAPAFGSGEVNSSRNITNLGGSVLAAGSGSTWTINGALSSTGALFAQGDGNVTLNGPQSYAPGSTLTLNGGVGMVTLATNAGSPAARNLTVNANFSNVTFDSTQHLAGLAVNSGRSATLTAGGNKVIVATFVTATGRLDLKDNKLITASAIGSWGGSAYTGITGRIDAGRGSAANAQWNGSGIVTTDTRDINNGDLC